MTPLRGKAIAFWSAWICLAVLTAAGFVFKDRIREEYWLWKLEKGDKAETEQAAIALGKLKSVRAVPELIRMARFPTERLDPVNFLAANTALSQIGPAAVPGLVQLLESEYEDARIDAAFSLGFFGGKGKPAISALSRAASQDKSELVRQHATEALKRIQGEEQTP